MGDGGPKAPTTDLATAIRDLMDVSLGLPFWAAREGVSLERIEPLIMAIDDAVGELRLVASVLLPLEQLSDVRPVGAKSPSLDVLAEYAQHSDPVIPDEILLRVQEGLFAARAAGVAPSATRRT